MTWVVHGTEALRGMHRRYKFLFVLTAAWAPILLATIPLLACSVVILATSLFFVSVSNHSTPSLSRHSGSHHEEP